METLLGIAVGIGLSAACGFRVFVPLLVMNLASLSGQLHLASGFAWIGSYHTTVAFATATIAEGFGNPECRPKYSFHIQPYRGKNMGIIWTIVLGFVIGFIAKLVHPGKENMGLIMTILLGIAGSFLAGVIGQFIGWYRAGEGAGFIASVIVAIILLVIYGKIKGKTSS